MLAMPETEEHAIRQLASYEVRPEALERCLAAIREFVAYVRVNEPGTLRYEVWQERAKATRFVHAFIFRDVEAQRIHSQSPEVKRFAAVLYPECLAPVEFTDFQPVASNADPRPSPGWDTTRGTSGPPETVSPRRLTRVPRPTEPR